MEMGGQYKAVMMVTCVETPIGLSVFVDYVRAFVGVRCGSPGWCPSGCGCGEHRGSIPRCVDKHIKEYVIGLVAAALPWIDAVSPSYFSVWRETCQLVDCGQLARRPSAICV